MDDFTIGGTLIERTLLEIERINQLLGGNQVTISGIRKLISSASKQTLAIADLGCGGGEISKLIVDLNKSLQQEINVIGIDANQNIIDFCRKRYNGTEKLSFEYADVLDDRFRNRQYDIITATLFIHHFSDSELVELLRSLSRQSTLGIVINDLHRHWFGYYAIKILTRLFSRSSMVKYDAPVSVIRAFRKSELISLLNEAGIHNYDLRWKWAFRWQLIIYC